MRIHQPFSRCSVATQPRHGPFVPPAQYGSSACLRHGGRGNRWRVGWDHGTGEAQTAVGGVGRAPSSRVNSGSSPSPSASPHPPNEAPPQPRERSGGMAGAQSGGKAPTRTTYRAPLAGRSRIGCVVVAARTIAPQARSGVSCTAGSGISTGAVGSGRVTTSGSGGSTGTGSSGMVMPCAVPGMAGVESAVPGSIRAVGRGSIGAVARGCVAIVMVGCAATAVLGQGLPAAAARRPARQGSLGVLLGPTRAKSVSFLVLLRAAARPSCLTRWARRVGALGAMVARAALGDHLRRCRAPSTAASMCRSRTTGPPPER